MRTVVILGLVVLIGSGWGPSAKTTMVPAAAESHFRKIGVVVAVNR